MSVVALMASSSDEQKNEWLPRMASGEVHVGAAVADFTGRRDSNGRLGTWYETQRTNDVCI